MKIKKILLAGVGLALAASIAPVRAGLDLNEVGAFLVFPGVVAVNEPVQPPPTPPPGGGGTPEDDPTETFLTITNTSSSGILAHVSFINGDQSSPEYCYECDFDVPMTGLDTETLVLTRWNDVTTILNLDSGAQRTCHQRLGFVTVDVEDFDHNVLTDNILLGDEVVVDYTAGSAFSVEALAVQGESGDGDRRFGFDGSEYRKFPSVVGTDFLAPQFNGYGSLTGSLILFTLAFDRQFPPLTDCSVIGFDAFESQFSNSFQFGCWTAIDLGEIDPEFQFPFLGDARDYQDHGWLQLSCTVYGTGTNGVVQGGVHGAIVQEAFQNDVLRHNTPNPPSLSNAAAWSRLLYQSGTCGDALTLHLEAPAQGGGY